MALSLSISPVNFAANPIVAQFNTGADADTEYTVIDSDNNVIFTGIINTAGADIDIDLSSLFYAQKYSASVHSYTLQLGTSQGDPTVQFKVYGGGISKLAMRAYGSASAFITNRIHTVSSNFLLTTRTASNMLYIPENELCPLSYYTGSDNPKSFKVKHGSTVLLTRSHASQTAESVDTIDLNAIRQSAIQSNNLLASVFDITDSSDQYLFTIVVEESVKATHALRFINSFGVEDQISLTTVIPYTPEVTPAENIEKYSTVISGFEPLFFRNSYKNKFKSTLQITESHTESVIMDLFTSSDVQLIDLQTQIAYKVSIQPDADLIFDKNKTTISALITLTDTDTLATPIADSNNYKKIQLDNDYLATETTDYVLTE